MDASRFLATTLWICTEQKVTVGDPEGRTSQEVSNDEQDHTQVPLLVESALNVRTIGSGSKVCLLSRIARSVLSVYTLN